MLRPGTRITNVLSPVAAPVIDLSSMTLADDGIMDPSDAQVRPSVAFDGSKPETETRLRMYSSAWACLMSFGIARSVLPLRRSSIWMWSWIVFVMFVQLRRAG